MERMKISIIGAGNLGSHLATGFLSGGADIVQIFSRDINRAVDIAQKVGANAIDALSNLNQDIDLALIAVHDDVIPSVATEIRKYLKNQMIAHTAGSVTSLVLHHAGNYGVFWPLQSFSKGRHVDWSDVPVLLTANNSEALDMLRRAALLLTKNITNITDQERLALHLSAAIANNFANHMFALAEKIAVENGLDFEILKPLIRETAAKVMTLPPTYAQTGPAVRGDEDTMAKHRQLLLENPEIMRLYNTISESINCLKAT
jgi:predicted short-subunit dehydrogenase-like oxidoreductase (DUF2520 family)